MNSFSRLTITVIGLAVVSGLCTGLAHADNTMVRWERIEGINPTPAPAIAGSGQTFLNTSLGNIAPVGFPWSTTSGRAQFNTETGHLQFIVKGLSLGANSPASMGTTGVFRAVRGTIVCHIPVTGGGQAEETGVVTLTEEGNAFYQGKLDQVPSCPASQMVFLLRVAQSPDTNSSINPALVGLWLAHGAVRRIQ